MPRIVKANDIERQAYAKTRPVYPLYGFVTISGQRCAVEDLRGVGAADDPKFEIMAPKNFHFDYDFVHSLLCVSLTDANDRASSADLVPCHRECYENDKEFRAATNRNQDAT